jgi:hypothetical protein
MKKNKKNQGIDHESSSFQTKGTFYVLRDDTENGISFSESPLRKSVEVNIHSAYSGELNKPEFRELIVELVTTEVGKQSEYAKGLKKMNGQAYEKLINSCALTSKKLEFRKRTLPEVKGKKPKYRRERSFG